MIILEGITVQELLAEIEAIIEGNIGQLIAN